MDLDDKELFSSAMTADEIPEDGNGSTGRRAGAGNTAAGERHGTNRGDLPSKSNRSQSQSNGANA